MARKPQTKTREVFGRLDPQRSGRFRARYIGPDKVLHAAPHTFRTKLEARTWLAEVQRDIANGTWRPPAVIAAEEARAKLELERKSISIGAYAQDWVAKRTNLKGQFLAARTREEYERLLRPAGTRRETDPGGPLAELVDIPICDLRLADVREWRAAQLELGTITQTSRAYDLLKSILKTALEDDLIDKNPCIIRGASNASTGKLVEPPTDEELEIILDSIHPRYRALVAICANGGLRYGEATALRAKHLVVERDSAGKVVCVRLKVVDGVVKVTGRRIEKDTKTGNTRDLAIYGEDAETVAELLKGKIANALVFTAVTTSTHLPQTTFFRHWNKARKAAGRSDMPFHALRHYAGTRYSQAGATVKETMERLGHKTPSASMRYQHAGNRDDELAMRMSRRRTGHAAIENSPPENQAAHAG